MSKPKPQFKIQTTGEPDFRCLPLWVAQDILLKIQAEQQAQPQPIATSSAQVESVNCQTITENS